MLSDKILDKLADILLVSYIPAQIELNVGFLTEECYNQHIQ